MYILWSAARSSSKLDCHMPLIDILHTRHLNVPCEPHKTSTASENESLNKQCFFIFHSLPASFHLRLTMVPVAILEQHAYSLSATSVWCTHAHHKFTFLCRKCYIRYLHHLYTRNWLFCNHSRVLSAGRMQTYKSLCGLQL